MCNVVGIYAYTNSASAMQVTRAPARTSTSTSESGNVRGRCSDAGSEDKAVDPAVVEANKTFLVPLCR